MVGWQAAGLRGYAVQPLPLVKPLNGVQVSRRETGTTPRVSNPRRVLRASATDALLLAQGTSDQSPHPAPHIPSDREESAARLVIAELPVHGAAGQRQRSRLRFQDLIPHVKLTGCWAVYRACRHKHPVFNGLQRPGVWPFRRSVDTMAASRQPISCFQGPDNPRHPLQAPHEVSQQHAGCWIQPACC